MYVDEGGEINLNDFSIRLQHKATKCEKSEYTSSKCSATGKPMGLGLQYLILNLHLTGLLNLIV